jgi:hypothetical protein
VGELNNTKLLESILLKEKVKKKAEKEEEENEDNDDNNDEEVEDQGESDLTQLDLEILK